VFNVAGNHDIGFNIPHDQQVQLVNTYITYLFGHVFEVFNLLISIDSQFGPLNFRTSFAGFDIYVVASTTMNKDVSAPAPFNLTNSFLETVKTIRTPLE